MPQILSIEEAMARAVAKAGSDDFGPAGIRENLARTLEAFSRVPLTREAACEVNAKIVQDLANRLQIEAWYGDHPEIEGQGVEQPVIVVGMPRTGTTATVGMLALDNRFRFLRGWEANAPVPPPVASGEACDPRMLAAHAAAANYQLSHLHLFDPDGPEEDLAFLASLDMHGYHGAYPMPGDYVAWWLDADFGSCYAYLERVFKLLHSRRPPRRWLLKSPPHLFRLDRLAEQYPDARFVMTHRDPRKLIASVASLHFTLNEQRCMPGTVDKKTVGRTLLEFWKEGVRRGMAARARIGEDRFIDVYNDDVVRRPVATFERIYDHIGLSLTPELVERLLDYNQSKAPGKFGAHTYSLEDYGLSEKDVSLAFAEYMERFRF
jgi:hypothetical protein